MDNIVITAPVDSLSSDNFSVKRGAILGLALIMDKPNYQLFLKADNNPDTVSITFDDNTAQVIHKFHTKLSDDYVIVGYVAEAKVTTAAGFNKFEKHVADGTIDKNFGTAYVVAPVKKIARLGLKDTKLATLPFDNLQDLHLKKDGLRVITNNAAYFVTTRDLVAWLKNPNAKLKSNQVTTFKHDVTVISRPTDDDIFYLSGAEMSFKVIWSDSTFEVIDTKPTKKQVLGPVADDDDTIVFGKFRETSEGLTTDLTFKPIAKTNLGYDTAATAK